MKAKLFHTESVTKNITTFSFQTIRPLDYNAGQYVQITLPNPRADNRGTTRWFTLSSSPTEPLISLTTRYSEKSMSTFKQQLFSLPIGKMVEISEPLGDFVLPKDPTIPLVFVAGGIGITPVRSIVKWLSDTKNQRDIHIIYRTHNTTDVAFYDELKSYNLKIDHIITSKNQTQARLTAKDIITIAKPTSQTLIYVSGPEKMVETLESSLKQAGISPSQLVLDFFHGYS